MYKREDEDAVVVGAGPYGLSVAAHLRGAGVAPKVFGQPMESWCSRMPVGMFLKSEGGASSLSDPAGRWTLERYCADRGIPYKSWGWPIPLDVFTDYALWFQAQLVPDVDTRMVTGCRQNGGVFEIELNDGAVLTARHVVIATGITRAARVPEVLAKLPPAFATHSSAHRTLGHFRGRQVVVVGAGQSALETAALLHEQGAQVTLVARRSELAWNEEINGARTPYARLRHPMTPLGPGLRNLVYIHAIPVFRLLPERVRVHEVRTALGPAGAWWLRRRIEGKIEIILDQAIEGVEVVDGRVVMHIRGNRDGTSRSIVADHVIAGTGYAITQESFPFLDRELLRRIAWAPCGPAISRFFESSVPGLYFAGLAAAGQHGPAMRFVAGAPYAARAIARHVARQTVTTGAADAA
jgi:thioredoxin reductase